MDDYETLIANLQRLRSDIDRVLPSDSVGDVLKRLEELRRRAEAIQHGSNPVPASSDPC